MTTSVAVASWNSTAMMLLKMITNKQNRQTKQKAFVRHYLMSHYDHPTAREIALSAKEAGLSLGLTSAYRLLEGLVEQGEAIEIKAGGVVHFDWQRGDHYHFVCDGCGKVFDLQQDKALFDELARRNAFLIPSIQSVVIHGYCPDCAKKKQG